MVVKMDSPREAAAVVIETNKVLRKKLAKASSVIKSKNLQIKDMHEKFSTQMHSLSDSAEINIDVTKYEDVIADQQNDILKLKDKLSQLDDENFKIKMELEQAQSERDDAIGRVEYLQESALSSEGAMDNAETARQLMIAMMHIAGLEAELEAFKKETPDDSFLYSSSDEEYEDGRLKSVARKTYEMAFDRRAGDLGIIDPERYRP